MLSESCLGVTAKLLNEFTVEPLEVSVANDEVLRITRYGLVELWLPSQQVDDAGRSYSEDIKVHFEAYLSPTSIYRFYPQAHYRASVSTCSTNGTTHC